MARTRRRSYARRRPTTRKRRARRRKATSLVGGQIMRLSSTRQMGSFSKRQIVTLNYSHSNTLGAPAAGATAELAVSTDPFNPRQLSGSWQQPTGYQEWNLFYKNYYVLKVSIALTITSNSSTQPPITTASIVYIRNSEGAGVVTDRTEALNSFNLTRKVFGLASSGVPIAHLRSTIVPHKFLTRPMLDDSMKGDFNNGILAGASKGFFHIGVTPLNNFAAGVAIHCEYTVKYTMALVNRQILEDTFT